MCERGPNCHSAPLSQHRRRCCCIGILQMVMIATGRLRRWPNWLCTPCRCPATSESGVPRPVRPGGCQTSANSAFCSLSALFPLLTHVKIQMMSDRSNGKEESWAQLGSKRLEACRSPRVQQSQPSRACSIGGGGLFNVSIITQVAAKRCSLTGNRTIP